MTKFLRRLFMFILNELKLLQNIFGNFPNKFFETFPKNLTFVPEKKTEISTFSINFDNHFI